MTLVTTERLELRLGEPDDAEAMVAYLEANRAHLEPFEPKRQPVDFLSEFWVDQFENRRVEYLTDRALRLLIVERDAPLEIAGTIALSNVIRGVKQSCTLGYGLAAKHQGKGYMTEAVGALARFAFGSLAIHRIEANYMPHNTRSASVLRRLGFQVEGYARDYLRINGRWEDHILTSLTNPDWAEPTA